MGIAEKFIKQGQLEQEEYPELLNLYKDPETVGMIRQEAVRIQKKYFGRFIQEVWLSLPITAEMTVITAESAILILMRNAIV